MTRIFLLVVTAATFCLCGLSANAKRAGGPCYPANSAVRKLGAADVHMTIDGMEQHEDEILPYLRRFSSNLRQAWRPPNNLRNYQSTIEFTIETDGRPTNIDVRQSSGIEKADRAATKALKKQLFELPKFVSHSVKAKVTFTAPESKP